MVPISDAGQPIKPHTQMSIFTNAELSMWGSGRPAKPPAMTDEEIDEKYETRDYRILTETNREQLPNFVQALARERWMELRPFYQRRLRWEPARQSKLIESFVMNIPVPPLFVYESEYGKYEVMDGQQRITAIKDFYSNNLRLTGLDHWPELNGRTYSKLPAAIRRGIDRRSISYTVMLAESAQTQEDKFLIRKLVFERLNTGGIELSHQEIRNSLFHGKLMVAIRDMSRDPFFRKAWLLPPYSESEESNPPSRLLETKFYSQMTDMEVVLRFLALRNTDHYQRGMQGFLDLYMTKGTDFSESDVANLKGLFASTIRLATDIYGDLVFRPWRTKTGVWADRPQIAFADAVMVGLWRNLDKESILRDRRAAILEATIKAFETYGDEAFTGKANTKEDVKSRIRIFDDMIKSICDN